MEENKKIEVKKTDEMDSEKVWSVVAYLCFPLPLIFARNRTKLLNYHINQSIILLIVSVLGQIILSSFFGNAMWSFPGRIWNLLITILMIVGIINAVNKKMEPLPVIGHMFTFLK